MVIHEDELTPEIRAKLKLDNNNKVPARVVVLGKLLQAVDGLTTRDALWAMRTAHSYILVKRYPKKKKKKAEGNGK